MEARKAYNVPTILYVDDSPKALRLLGSVFQMRGYTVLTADDPRRFVAVYDRYCCT